MLLIIAIVIIISILSRIPVGEPYIEFKDIDASKLYDPHDNGTREKFILDNAWEFDSIDDCMEFRELRQTGWRGDINDFYKWKSEMDED